jgi:hypothetical protein
MVSATSGGIGSSGADGSAEWPPGRDNSDMGGVRDAIGSAREEFMIGNTNNRRQRSRRLAYPLLAALLFLIAVAALVALWQRPHSTSLRPWPAVTATRPAISLPTTTPTPSPTATPTPALSHPAIADLGAEVDDEAKTITFHLAAEVPPGRRVARVLLWYDTEVGRQVQHISSPWSDNLDLSHQVDMAQEGLTRTLTTTADLDYWWLVRDTAGESIRAGGTVQLGPALQALVATPIPEPPPLDFTWALSESQHFQFYHMVGTAAERDLDRLAHLAEASLARITSVLEMELDGQMRVYLVPRVFWQGGAAYGDKVQLISYLDRNYTGVEIWSYFTHEGTHALAQDLLQPKDDGGGPDGVLVEGLAVWASDGHYRQEPIDAWAAVIAASDRYIPLKELRAGPFYEFQHEISYMESASFVKFLIERYGLHTFKELYGRSTSDADHDAALVQELYGTSYEALEADWLTYLSGLDPAPRQAKAWEIQVRSFDLMRRYQTELDPDARFLPPSPPPEWTSDTLRIFVGRADAPVNIVLETALVAVQERLHRGDLDGAAALLDDVEGSLDAGGALTPPSLEARRAIYDLVAAQDRAVLRADSGAYRSTLEPIYALALGTEVEKALQIPTTTYRQEIVRLDLAADGLHAEGMVLVHAQVVQDAGQPDVQSTAHVHDGQLFAVAFTKTPDGWIMSNRAWIAPALLAPPSASEGNPYLVWLVAPDLPAYAPEG